MNGVHITLTINDCLSCLYFYNNKVNKKKYNILIKLDLSYLSINYITLTLIEYMKTFCLFSLSLYLTNDKSSYLCIVSHQSNFSSTFVVAKLK